MSRAAVPLGPHTATTVDPPVKCPLDHGNGAGSKSIEYETGNTFPLFLFLIISGSMWTQSMGVILGHC